MGNKSTKPSPSASALPQPPPLPGTPQQLDALKAATVVHLPGTQPYEESRHNGTWLMDPAIFGFPSAIVIPRNAREVAAAVSFAKETGVRLCVACGRHTHLSIRQGDLMIDMTSAMNQVTVDPATRLVTVAGGAKIGLVDAALAPHKLIIPLGRVPSTGTAGQMYTTGGQGFFSGKFGYGIDSMVGAVVVTGRGDIVTCSKDENPELFWSIRGSGCLMWVIVEMTFLAHPAPNDGNILYGAHVYLNTGLFGMPTRRKVLNYVRERMNSDLPDDKYVVEGIFIGGAKTNPSIVAHGWLGDDLAEGQQFFANNVKRCGVRVANTVQLTNYWTGVQRAAIGPKGDQFGPSGYYFRGVTCDVFSEEMVEILDRHLNMVIPNVANIILVERTKGKQLQEPPEGTGLIHRQGYWFILVGGWDPKKSNNAGREAATNWVRSVYNDLVVAAAKSSGSFNPHALESGGLEGLDQLAKDMVVMGQQVTVNGLWGKKEDRLKAAKDMYDPDSIFGKQMK